MLQVLLKTYCAPQSCLPVQEAPVPVQPFDIIRWYSSPRWYSEFHPFKARWFWHARKYWKVMTLVVLSTLSFVQKVPSFWWILTLYFTQFEMWLRMKSIICSSWTSLRTWWVSAWFWQKVSSQFALTFPQQRGKDDGHPWQRTQEQHHAMFKSEGCYFWCVFTRKVPLQKFAYLSIRILRATIVSSLLGG